MVSVLIGLVSFIIGCFVQSLLAYFTEKGKNYATKEDIEKITHKIEAVKAAINVRFHISRFRYEKEFELLKALTERIVTLRNTACSLRPVFDAQNPSESDKERNNRRLTDYGNACEQLRIYAQFNSPFYPQEIGSLMIEFDKVCTNEAINFQVCSQLPNHQKDVSYWETSEKNSKEIISRAEVLMEAIRRRLVEWEEIDLSSEKPGLS